MARRLLVVPLSFALSVAAQQPIPLHNGQQITLHGLLAMRPAGRLQFVAVQTPEAYLPIVSGHTTQPTHSVGVTNFHRYELLYAHRGQAVTASGTVMTDDASPYYLNHVLLRLTSVRLANGTDLLGRPRSAGSIAVDAGQYQATVLLPAEPAAPWRYIAHGQPDPEHRFLSCGSNGGGDVVNCSCGQGFHAMQAESSAPGVSAQVFSDSHTAQFGVGDQARRVELSVTCSR